MKRRAQILAILLAAAMAVPTTVPTMVYADSAQESTQSTYGQITNSAGFVTNFTFENGFNSSGVGTPVFTDGDYAGQSVAVSNRMLGVNGTATVKIPNGFKYYNGEVYDILITVTNTSQKEYGGNWSCSIDGNGTYLTLQPNTTDETSFDYEIWLEKDGVRVNDDIDLVAGSCFTASTEGARPYGDNGEIYTNITPTSSITWDETYKCWTPSDADAADKYILGHGKESNGSIRGGYVRKSGSGGAEMVIGYLIKTQKFQNSSSDSYGTINPATLKIAEGKTIIAPTVTPATGYYLVGWTTTQDVTLTDGTKIAAGTIITQENLNKVVANDSYTFTAKYGTCNVKTDTNNNNGQDLVVEGNDGSGNKTELARVSISAANDTYDGAAYDGTVTATGMTDLQKYYSSAAASQMTYYVANADGTISTNANGDITSSKTTVAGNGAASEGGAPKDAGTYYVAETITTTQGTTKTIYAKFEIAKKTANATVTANDKTYDGNTTATVKDVTVDTGIADETITVNKDSVSVAFQNKNAGTNKTVDVTSTAASANAGNGTKLSNYDIKYNSTTTASIGKKDVTVEVQAADKTYDGNTNATVTGSVTTGINGEELSISGLSGNFDNANVGNNKNVEVLSEGARATAGNANTNASNYNVTYPSIATANITKADQTAPNANALVPTAETIDGKADGSILALTTEMEYSADGGKTWTKITNPDMPFADGIYQIRYSADGNHNASSATSVTVNQGRYLAITVTPEAEKQVGYALTTSKTQASWNDETTITLTVDKGYSLTDDFAIVIKDDKDNETKITKDQLTENADGSYTCTLKGIQTDKTISADSVVDKTAPTGEISITQNTWKEVVNVVSFGKFFKESKDVTITATDEGSGMDTIEYYVSTKQLSDEEIKALADDSWKTYDEVKKFSLNKNSANVVYAKLTDKDGNVSYLSSDGVVIYTDAEQETKSVTYTKASDADQTAKVKLNENTVASIKNGESELVKGKDYTVSEDGTITLSASYLQSLPASEDAYTLTVSYNPYGYTYVDDSKAEKPENQAPVSTTFALNVTKAVGSVQIENLDSMGKTYDGTAVTAPIVKTESTGEQTIQYRKKGASDDSWTTEIPKDAGNYEVKVTVAADDDYTAAEVTGEFTIAKRPITAKVAAEDKTYDGNTDAEMTATVETGVKGETLTITGVVGTFEDKNAGTGKTVATNAENAVVTPGEETTDVNNYAITYVETAKADILKKEVTVTADSASKIYGDADPVLTWTNTALVDGDTLNGIEIWRVEGEDVGDYVIVVTQDLDKNLNPNYEVNFTAGQFVIEKKSIANAEVTLGDTLIYTGENQTQTVKSVVLDGKTLNPEDYVITENTGSKAGTYTLTIKAAEDGNYKDSVTKTFTIEKAEGTVQIENLDSLGKTYDGDVITAPVIKTESTGEQTVLYHKKGASEDAWTPELPKDAGDYEVKVTVAADDNHTEATVTGEFTIAKKKITATVAAEDKTYDGSADAKVSATVETGVEGESFTVTGLTGLFTDANAGEDKTVVVNVNGAVVTENEPLTDLANYEISYEKETKADILKKDVTVTADAKSKVYGEEDPELSWTNTKLVGDEVLSDLVISRAEGENAGTYDITVGQKEDANPNYNVTFEGAALTIEKKSIADATVSLGKALIYNGENQTQEVATVTLPDGTVLSPDDYEITANEGTEPGAYKLTIKAKEDSNYKDGLEWTFVISPKVTEQTTENENGAIELGDGTASIEVKSKNNAPKATLETPKVDMLNEMITNGDLTADDLSVIANGNDVDLVLTVEDITDTVSRQVKNEVKNATTKDEKVGMYVDLTLMKYLTIDGVTDDGEEIPEVTDKVKISFEIPESLRNTDGTMKRSYKLLLDYNGKVEVVEGTYDETTHLFTFETNKFCEGALVYTDEAIPQEKKAETPAATPTAKPAAKSTAVKTADVAAPLAYGGSAFAAGIAAAASALFRRKKNKK